MDLHRRIHDFMRHGLDVHWERFVRVFFFASFASFAAKDLHEIAPPHHPSDATVADTPQPTSHPETSDRHHGIRSRTGPNEQEIWDEPTMGSYARRAARTCALCARTVRARP